jgi:hypothetical protein
MEPDDDAHELTLTSDQAKVLARQMLDARAAMDTFRFNLVYEEEVCVDGNTSDIDIVNVAKSKVLVRCGCSCWPFMRAGIHNRPE